MRKTTRIMIDDEGRDKGKIFQITELSAMQAEEWAARAMLALTNSGVDIPDDISQAGMAGLAAMGIKALSKISFQDLKPLLTEMFSCIQIVPNPATPNFVRPLVDGQADGDDIEEVLTRIRLRAEVFKLHTGFLPPAGPSNSTAATTGHHSKPTQTVLRRSGT